MCKSGLKRNLAREVSKLETIRCLKRYLAREVYYLLNPGTEHITPDTKPHKTAA